MAVVILSLSFYYANYNFIAAIVSSLTLVIEWLTGRWGSLPCPASPERITLCITSPGKDQNSEFQVRFLLKVCHCHTLVRSKNHEVKPSIESGCQGATKEHSGEKEALQSVGGSRQSVVEDNTLIWARPPLPHPQRSHTRSWPPRGSLGNPHQCLPTRALRPQEPPEEEVLAAGFVGFSKPWAAGICVIRRHLVFFKGQKRLVAERFCCPGGAGCRRALVTPGGGRREARAKPWGLGCCCRSPCLQHDKVQTPGRNATPSRGQPPITGLDGTRLGVSSWAVRLPPGAPLSLQSMRPFSSSSPPMVRPFFSLLYR
ncbi:uncharacterized protein LOC112663468 [Canis lupus dingo]|uniref:uncharacterized protein LOC112663468 n=1 Tax=Canis lupus dingo TaxID=286419 RepID=UPI000DC6AF76|nr:uncharacterized protein LOC112663468 [Canis lupus dingo]